jgi:hypothetical protein
MPEAYTKSVEWTLPMLRRFKKSYRAAVTSGADTFIFDKHEFVVGYAAYLIQYLEQQFAKV